MRTCDKELKEHVDNEDAIQNTIEDKPRVDLLLSRGIVVAQKAGHAELMVVVDGISKRFNE
jgi:hypothetical protein